MSNLVRINVDFSLTLMTVFARVSRVTGTPEATVKLTDADSVLPADSRGHQDDSVVAPVGWNRHSAAVHSCNQQQFVSTLSSIYSLVLTLKRLSNTFK